MSEIAFALRNDAGTERATGWSGVHMRDVRVLVGRRATVGGPAYVIFGPAGATATVAILMLRDYPGSIRRS